MVHYRILPKNDHKYFLKGIGYYIMIMIALKCRYCTKPMKIGDYNDYCHTLWHYRYNNRLCVICGDTFEAQYKFHHLHCEVQGYQIHYRNSV